MFLVLLMDGDIESNPGPKTKTKNPKFFSCCRWNVDRVLAHNKLSMLEAYNIAHKYNLICISESYLDSTVPLDDNSVYLNTLLVQTILIMLREEVYVLQGKLIP